MTASTVLITGASSGIGRACAEVFRDAGFTVFATARTAEAAAALTDEGFHGLVLDVTRPDSALSAVRLAEAHTGRLDVLVNNAGYGVHGPMEEVTVEDLKSEFEVNVFGMVRMSQLVLPGMRRARAGRIINVGSVGGLFTAPGAGAYHMSKYAVESFSDALRMEVAPFGVHVVLLEPTGVRRTPFIDKQLATMSRDAAGAPYGALKRAMLESIPQLFVESSRATVTPQVVARAALEAATARRPRTRYTVGLAAKVLRWVRWLLSDATFDRLAQAQFATRER
jgi:NAD(P)-dependent dehydrogenase (short-subunit alcohol dehydrogenase family)